jgi:hypothetical protein
MRKPPSGGSKWLSFMVRPERFERPTYWFVASCSIQLSYGRTGCLLQLFKNKGIELRWQPLWLLLGSSLRGGGRSGFSAGSGAGCWLIRLQHPACVVGQV